MWFYSASPGRAVRLLAAPDLTVNPCCAARGRDSRVTLNGRRRNDEEFYLLIERINDVDDDELTENDRRKANQIILQYEQSKRT